MNGEWIGFVLPPVIDLINKKIANSNVRFGVSLLFCLVVGVVLQLIAGKLSFNDVPAVLQSAGLVFATAQTTYKLYWKDASLRENALFTQK